MKRGFSILLILCLLTGSACAETLREQVDAPAAYQAEYFSHTGNSTILVDAKVDVPDVSRISTYAVTGRDVALQDVQGVALAAAPETDWLTDWQAKPFSHREWSGNRDDFFYERHQEDFSYGLAFTWYPQFDGSADYSPYRYGHEAGSVWAINSFRDTVFGPRRTETKLEYDYHQIKDYSVQFYAGEAYLEPVQQTPSPNQKLRGQSLTWGEATAMAEAFAAQAAPGFSLCWVGQGSGEGTSRKAYAFRFSRVIDGIPVTYARTGRSGDQPEEQHYASPPRQEDLACVIDQDRIVSVFWLNPWEIGEVLQRDVELLPFSQIMDIFGAIAPLTIQSMEGEEKVMGGEKNRWEIKEIRLGYMPVLRKDGSGEWELRPVWDFIGIRIFAREYYDFPGNTALTIDAIDGTVIDRAYGY